MNKVQENLLKSLGLELNQEFDFGIDGDTNRYKFILENEKIILIRQKRDGCWDTLRDYMFDFILIIIITYPERVKPLQKPILTEKEKQYLEAVLKPFKDRIMRICKIAYYDNNNMFCLCIDFFDEQSPIYFPYFEPGTMYNGMETDKKYTLEELGLFEE